MKRSGRTVKPSTKTSSSPLLGRSRRKKEKLEDLVSDEANTRRLAKIHDHRPTLRSMSSSQKRGIFIMVGVPAVLFSLGLYQSAFTTLITALPPLLIQYLSYSGKNVRKYTLLIILAPL